MKILIDIGHPAHVHYFKNFIRIMTAKGHQFALIARNKEITHTLLQKYGLSYISRGEGGSGKFGKALYIFKADHLIWKAARRFQPDLFLSFASTYAAHVARFMGKPHIAFDDTEHAKWELLLYPPFTTSILTPVCFKKKLGIKQIFFNGYMELCYLHPNYFQPEFAEIKFPGLQQGEPYVIFRFVSWKASHDFGTAGLGWNDKTDLVRELSKQIRVFISSEGGLPDALKPYQVDISPENMHDLLANAKLLISEGATMASEAAMLGVPSFYINPLTAGTLEEQERYGLLYRNLLGDRLKEKIFDILKNPLLKKEFQEKRRNMLSDKIDVTAFIVWFVEDYPISKTIMQNNPRYQDKFRLQYNVHFSKT